MAKDYYETLGVGKNASQDEIKRAYKELAKKYHPDLNKNKGAEDKFKEINEAYKVLGDEKSRTHYNQFGTADFSGFQGGGAGGFDFRGFGFEDFGDIFGEMFGVGGRKRTRRGADLRYDIEITLEDVAFGAEKEIRINKLEKCSKCNGLGGTEAITCPECQGTGMQRITRRTPFGMFSTTSTCSKCNGQGSAVKHQCKNCDGTGRVEKEKTIKIRIPSGVDEGTSLRITGEGEAGEKGAPAGDLYVVIHVKKHNIFERDEFDIHTTIPISFVQAVFGDEIEVPTLDGKARLKIPAGTQSNTMFRMKEHGIRSMRGHIGDEFVKVTIQVPAKLSKKQRELLEEYAKESKDEINLQKGFWSKLKEAFE